MGTLTTNVNLVYYDMKETNKCSFCDKEKESMLHLFVFCEKTYDLMKYIRDILLNCPNCVYAPRNILFSTVYKNQKHPANTIILLYKYYIYCERCRGENLTVNSLKLYIEKHVELEASIDIRNNKESLHIAKWNDVIPQL